MKKLFCAIAVAVLAMGLIVGCGADNTGADCESSYDTFCDEGILYLVDFCGTTTTAGECRHGCNSDFSGCQVACD
jgi:hypothetical protein